MRLRTWIAVVVSVILLAAAGVIGILVNRSALHTADEVHEADSVALGVNNGMLAAQLQSLAAQELGVFGAAHPFALTRGNKSDKALLTAFSDKSSTFTYGVVITDLAGNILTASRAEDYVPAAGDSGWAPLRASVKEGKPGYSSVMSAVGGIDLEAVGVPLPMTVGSRPVAILAGLVDVSSTSLQNYTYTLAVDEYRTAIVDSTGKLAASSDPGLLGTKVAPEVQAEISKNPENAVVRYKSGGTAMVAIIVGGLPGGWAYVRIQTESSFDGAVHTKSQTLNLTLIAMLLIGVAGIALLGYRTMLQRRRADQRFHALFQHAPDLVSVVGASGVIEYSSPSASSVLGFENGILAGSNVFELVHAEDRPLLERQFTHLLANGDGVVRQQCRIRAANGEYRWFEVTASNQMQNPSLHGVVINARDVTENRAFQDRLAHEAQHDPLTGLPNRRRMQDALGSALRADAVAVLFVDLDGFKPVNDAYGHEAGDDLLRQVAQRLSDCVREKDVLARVGGDEFVVLMPGALSAADVEAARDRIRDEMRRPFPIDGHQVQIGASVGVHLAAEADDPDEALKAADHAMYAVKKSRSPEGRHRRQTDR